MIIADVAIVGAGIAGASLAAEVAAHARVVLIETESQPGYHSTGRSAAFWTETYGGPAVQPLTTASGPWLRERGFLKPRGALHVAGPDGGSALDAMAEAFAGGKVELQPVDRSGLEKAIPGLRRGHEHGLAEPSCADIDAAALHAFYLKAAAKAGATLLCDAELLAVSRSGGWRLETRAGIVEADILVNAAGAWAGPVAALAGASAIPIMPYRRTIVQLVVDPPASVSLPLVIDAEERYYFKPEAGGRLWLSPHDETPVGPCDATPEELDVALAIDRFEKVVDWRIVKRERAWAGLRSFAPDRAPVYGFDPAAPDFFWFAGQGGFGIQTAPAAAVIGAALLLRQAMPAVVCTINLDQYKPDRF